MKTLVMPARSHPPTMPAPRVERHLRAFAKSFKYIVTITVVLLIALAATLILTSALAFALSMIVAVVAAAAAALVFMVVSPEGNLLLLVLLSQLWLLYAPRERTPDLQPDGGLTIKPRYRAVPQTSHSLAA